MALGLLVAFGGACKGKGKTEALPATLPAVTLPADDLEAGRALGRAAATEKDPDKLAATLVAFLGRVHVSVFSEKWDKLLATGPKPGPSVPWFWEPVLVGVARATAAGQTSPFAEVLAGFIPKLDPKKTAKLDFRDFVAQLAAAAAKEPLGVDGPIAAAIVEDLKTRKLVSSRPQLDPTATLLFGLLLVAEQNALKASPPAPPTPPPPKNAPPSIPGLPFGLKIPVQPPRTVHLMDPGGAAPTPQGLCASMAKANQWAGTAFSGGTWVGKQLTGQNVVPVPSALTSFMQGIADVMDGATIAGEVVDGVSGMGIAAFVTASGNVSPTSVKYGDGPATFTINAQSASPFTKDQLNQFVDCLEQMPGSAAVVDGLRNLPPSGGVPNLPVLWLDTGKFDPKHGTFTPTQGQASGIAATAIQMGMSAVGGGATDGSGQAKATFQVKPKKGDNEATYARSYTVDAQVFPYPLGASPVFAASNLMFHISVPIVLEIKAAFDSYDLTLVWSDRVQPPGNVYFEDGGQATVKIKINGADLSFHASAKGTHALTLPQQSPGPFVTCSAPVGGQPVDVQVDGKITDVDSMTAEVHIKVTPESGREPMTIKCQSTLGGKAAVRHANAIVGSISQGTELENFTMTLGDGEQKSVSTDKSAGPMEISGAANVSLAVDNGS